MRRPAMLALTAALLIGPAAPALADHDHGDQSYEDQWSNEDRNRNRDRNRGAFSPGPFDDSPVDAFNNACMPGATCTYNPPPKEEPT